MFFFTRQYPSILKNSPLARDDKFLQFLAFGAFFSQPAAQNAITWFCDCKSRWIASGRESDWGQMNREEKYRFMDSLLVEFTKELTNDIPHDSRLWLGLSSGLDSRLLHYSLRKAGVHFKTYTFGQIGDLDFDLSQILSERMGFATTFFDTSEIRWDLDWYDQVTALVRDHPLSPRVVTAQLLRKKEGLYIDIHGYLNDSVTGKRATAEPNNNWPAAKNVFCSNNDTFEFQQFFRRKSFLQHLPDTPHVDHEQLTYDQQLYLGYRQAQRIRPKDYAGMSHICPFEDWRWVGFWLNRNIPELLHQALYIDFITNLEAEEFFELQAIRKHGKPITMKERIAFVYGQCAENLEKQSKYIGKVLPDKPTGHFNPFACYQNNKSFRKFVDNTITRTKQRGVFRQGFVDNAMNKFISGDKRSFRNINGIISTDIAIETGLFPS